MQLSEFPQAIAQSELALLQQKQDIQGCQTELDALTNAIDAEIAFDATLKNDAQRKVRRFELMQTDEFTKTATRLQNLQTGLTRLEIGTRSLQNQFAIAKLQMRYDIAQMELQASTHAEPGTHRES